MSIADMALNLILFFAVLFKIDIYFEKFLSLFGIKEPFFHTSVLN